MNINFNYFSNYAVSFLNDSVLPSLSAQQKKILVVVSLALGCLGVACAISRYYFKAQLNTQYSLKNLFEDPQALQQVPILESDKITLISNYPFIKHEDMSSEIMKGEDALKRKILAFKMRITIPPATYQDIYRDEVLNVLNKDQDNNLVDERVLILFQRTLANPKIWRAFFPGLFTPEYPFFNAPVHYDTGPIEPDDKKSFQRLQTLIKDGRLEYNNCIFELV